MFWKLAHPALSDRLRERYTVCRLFDQVWQKGHQEMAEMAHSLILRMVSLLVPVCLASIPVEAQYSGGSGAAENPYRIATAADLIALGETPEDYDKHFILTADIDLYRRFRSKKVVFSEAVIAPAPSWKGGIRFSGTFDGDGHTISHLTVAGESCLGLFGELGSGAMVSNLGLEAVDINGTGHSVGGLAGRSGESHIVNCYSTGTVKGGHSVGGLVGHGGASHIVNCYSTVTVKGDHYVGGLMGHSGDGHIVNCCSTATVAGDRFVGGLVGSGHFGSITNCYSTAAITGRRDVGGLMGRNLAGTVMSCYSAGSVAGEWTVGGLVGRNATDWGPAKIIDCYSLASVTGTRAVGGLVGDNEPWCAIGSSYSAGSVTGNENVGGLAGGNDLHGRGGTVHNNCFWDMETSGQTTSNGGIGKTTAEMRMASTFIGWRCDLVWTIDEGLDYPRLRWENVPGELIANPSYGGGTGTEADPYLIYTPEQLNAIGLTRCDWDKHFRLMADIDLSAYDGTSFNIIGKYLDCPFVGVFDGQGHTISNFRYASTGADHIGLFGYVGYYEGEDGAIKNLGLLSPGIDAGTGRYVGSLVGWNSSSTITSCYVAGGSVAGDDCIGGLV